MLQLLAILMIILIICILSLKYGFFKLKSICVLGALPACMFLHHVQCMKSSLDLM